MSNSSKIPQIIRSHFLAIQKVKRMKILGIHFSIESETTKSNWQSTINKIRSISFEYRFDKISIYGKVAIINALIIPHIIFLARVFLPLKSQIKTLQYIFHKFLWYPSYIEPIQRNKLTPDHKDGGIRMPDVESTIKTSFIMKIIDLIQNKNLNLFYAAYAKYNLHRNLKNLNRNLHLRNSLNRPTPNPTWKQAIELIQSIKTSTESWQNLKFRDLYWKFLNPIPNPLPKNKRSHSTNILVDYLS